MKATITLHLTREEAIALAHELRDFGAFRDDQDDPRPQILNALCEILDVHSWDL